MFKRDDTKASLQVLDIVPSSVLWFVMNVGRQNEGTALQRVAMSSPLQHFLTTPKEVSDADAWRYFALWLSGLYGGLGLRKSGSTILRTGAEGSVLRVCHLLRATPCPLTRPRTNPTHLPTHLPQDFHDSGHSLTHDLQQFVMYRRCYCRCTNNIHSHRCRASSFQLENAYARSWEIGTLAHGTITRPHLPAPCRGVPPGSSYPAW